MPMSELYINILVESIQKKMQVLDAIITENQKQREGLEDPNLDPDDFDSSVEKKAEYIEEIDRLDDGFERLYEKVRAELEENRDKYREQILTLQNLIRKVTEKSMVIQKQESQNKELMEQKFAAVRSQVKEVRKSQKIVNQYYKNMMKRNYIDPQFLDNKK